MFGHMFIPYSKVSASTIRGRRVWHGDTTDESPVLPVAFRRDRPPYSLKILQWRPNDNDPCTSSETL